MTERTSIFETVTRRVTTDAQAADMFYDWFCKDSSLPKKGQRLLAKLRVITPSPRFDSRKTYAFFKNNCPMDGSLYDDFRICDIDTGDVVYCVVPSEGYRATKGQSCVWGRDPSDNEFKELVRGSWGDVKNFFREYDSAKVQAMIELTKMGALIDNAEYENREFDRLKKQEADEYREQLSHLLGVQV